MKQAIGYIRISTKDQSNFSLSGQENYIREFCKKNNYPLLSVFKDEGQSAKNFDRPDWKSLEAFIQKNHKQVDYLIVAKYDRFSRNLADALAMIETLEKKFGIQIMSVMEPIMMPASSPYFFQVRTQMLLSAHVEWMVIRDRTKCGIRQATMSGRYTSKAPVGYLNSRDEKNKPILLLDPEKVEAIQQVFELFLQDVPITDIKKIIRKKGIRMAGKSAVHRILNQCLYAGLVKAPAYNEEPEKLVKGIHEPIIDEATWWKVQAILKGKDRKRKHKLNEDFPLRGALRCWCGRYLTAGHSTSKSKKKYPYYFCVDHHNPNLNGVRIHEQFDGILQHLSLSTVHIEYLKNKVLQNLNNEFQQREKDIASKQSQLTQVLRRLENIEEKYINNNIEKPMFEKWYNRSMQERALIEADLVQLKKPVETIWNAYNENLSRLGDLHWIYHKGTIQQKHSFINLVFANRLYYQDEIFRTPLLMKVFTPKATLLAEKRLLIVEQPKPVPIQNFTSSPSGSSFEPVRQLLYLFSQIKSA